MITSPGPDVLTSCGNQYAVLTFGKEYIMGIGGACEPINKWSPISDYTSEDMEFIRRAAGNINVCDSANVVVSSTIASLAISIFILVITN